MEVRSLQYFNHFFYFVRIGTSQRLILGINCKACFMGYVLHCSHMTDQVEVIARVCGHWQTQYH